MGHVQRIISGAVHILAGTDLNDTPEYSANVNVLRLPAPNVAAAGSPPGRRVQPEAPPTKIPPPIMAAAREPAAAILLG